eukprot:GEMP01087819.1.p1 GENE.GEMP01087819.1~~GEMP01087819.1.p1  ORF type:complete len:188 (+),score=57.96 GEMP01087819.1:29-592(+)
MRLVLEITASHDDLAVYQAEINNLFVTHGVPESYAVHISKRALKRSREEPGEDEDVEEVDEVIAADVDEDEPTAKVARVENGKGGKKGKDAKGKGKGTKGAKGTKGKGAKGGKGSKQPRYSGTIRKFNSTRGYYFVACPELQAHFGCDVVLQKGDVPAGADVGTEISFIAMESDELRNPVAQQARLA